MQKIKTGILKEDSKMSVMIEKAYLDRMVLKMERDSLNLKAVIDAMGPLKYVFIRGVHAPWMRRTFLSKHFLQKTLWTVTMMRITPLRPQAWMGS